MEHRHGRRIALRSPATLSSLHGAPIRGELLNLSAGGALLRVADTSAAVPRVVNLVFRMPSTCERPFEWRALVLRREADTVALMFDENRPRGG